LIDADALAKKFDEKCGNECGCCEYAVTKTVLVGYAKCRIFERCGLIENAPTVDAIPVEWLREKMLRPQMTDGNPFGFVLAEWLEEQEAR
jgi:hypothetical protein